MSSYTDADGKPRSALNLVQSKLYLHASISVKNSNNTFLPIDRLEVLSPKKSTETAA
jgi:hypothetical protein